MIKKFTAFLCAVMAMIPIVANGAVLSEEEWAKMVTFSPNPTVRNEVLPKKIYIGAASGYSIEYVSSTNGEPTLTLPDNTVVNGLFSPNDFIAELTGRILMEFSQEYDQPGTYTLTIPAGKIKVVKGDNEMGTNPEYKVTYDIQEPKVIVNTLVDPVFIPASGSTVASISGNLSITFPKAEPGWTLACYSGVCIELECVEGEDEGDAWTVYGWDWYVDDNGVPDRNRCVLNFKNVITTPGKYELRFAKSVFKTFIDGEEIYNPEPFVAVFTVGEIGDEEITLDNFKAVDPSNEEPVKSLGVLHVEFPNCGAPEYGLEKGDRFQEPGVCGAPEPAEATDDEPEAPTIYTNIYLYRKEDAAVRFADSWSILPDGKTIEVITKQPFTQDGEYSLHIPAGMLKVKDYTPATYNTGEIPINYTLKYDPNIVDVIDGVSVVKVILAPVYDLNGNKVLDLATEADLQTLPADIYIFNSRKIVVK